ncbi:unnamed protein product [Paramecium octaurelia]|uniref:Uncharacterized protein n=1 Tax=Paramecium octaurelia TaxID=43137 RepID=A0A8S1V6U1_PAROT|nr:unnamed protein product [Paramecium octaurelia]
MITGHNASTIKAIYQVYKKQGRINKKVKRDKVLNQTFQFMLFVVDDPHSNLTKISVEQHEFQKLIAEEQHMNLSNSQEQAITRILEQNKLKIMNLLDNASALDTFNQEMNLISSQDHPSQQFSTLNLSCFRCKEKNQPTFLISKNKQFLTDLISENQEDVEDDEKNKFRILKTLNEQYRQMKM